MFSDYFKRIFCVNLARRTDRWESASKYFSVCGVPAKRFEAIDARDFEIKHELKTSACACSLSHIHIIQQAKFCGWDNVFVFEDDVELKDGFNQIFDRAIKDVPDDWELLYLGASHHNEAPPPVKITDNVFRVTKGFCTHAYAIRSTVYDIVLADALRMAEPIDSALTRIQQRGKSYVINPPIAFQREDYSDVEQRNMNYSWIRKPLQ